MWIKKNPFERGVDPTAVMVEMVAAEAASDGHPLTTAEREMLASEVVVSDARERLSALVERIVEREIVSLEWKKNPRCFIAAIEWAGDGAYPYIVQAAEAAYAKRRPKLTRPNETASFLVKLLLLGAAVCAVVLVIKLAMESL